MSLTKIMWIGFIIAFIITGVTIATMSLSTPLVNTNNTEKGKLLDSNVIAAYKPGDTIHINFVNQDNTTIYLPNDSPWRIDMNTSNGWITVYEPQHSNTTIAIEPLGYMHWEWNQKFNNGNQAPEGYYRIVLQTTKKVYTADFLISSVYSKIDWVILADILNKSVGDEKSFEVIVFFNANVTESLINEMVDRIGNFTIVSNTWKELDYTDSITIRALKSQIIRLAEWDLVRRIENNTVIHISR